MLKKINTSVSHTNKPLSYVSRSIRSAIFSRISGYGDRAWRKGKLDRDHEASLEWGRGGGRVREGHRIEGGHRDKGWENFHIERAANRDRRV